MQSPASTRFAWTAVAFAFLFMVLNFADKAVLGLSSVHIIQELHLTHTQFGLLGSGFFLLFSISGVAVGFLANRVRTKTLMLLMSIAWSAALLPVTRVSGFATLAASRVVLGAAEGPAFPVAMHSVYKWFDDGRRALPSSVVASGAAFGAGIIAPGVAWIIERYGWRVAFGMLAVAGIGWAALWALWGAEGSDESPAISMPDLQAVAYRRLILCRTAVGVFIAGFAAYWIIALNLVWLANYLAKALQMSPAGAAWVIALPSAMQIALAPAAALVSQRLTRSGVSSRHSRGTLGGACVIAAGISMACMPFLAMGPFKIALVGLSFSIGSVIFTLGSTLIGEISPRLQRGAMLGISNSLHTLAGVCAPLVMGRVVDLTANPVAGFKAGFLYAGCFVAALGVIASLLINPEEDLRRFRNASDF